MPTIESNASKTGMSRLSCGCEACSNGWVVCITEGLGAFQELAGGPAGVVAPVDPTVIVPMTVFTLGKVVPYVSVRLPAGSMMVAEPVTPEGVVNE